MRTREKECTNRSSPCTLGLLCFQRRYELGRNLDRETIPCTGVRRIGRTLVVERGICGHLSAGGPTASWDVYVATPLKVAHRPAGLFTPSGVPLEDGRWRRGAR